MPDTRKLVAGRYRLAGQIGTGGMGRVWLARDEVLQRDVAVKEVVLPTGLAENERQDLVEGTLREARAAGRLSHPNVVQVYDVVMFEDRPWIVMEYVPSRSLYQVIRTDGPLQPRRVAEIGVLVLAALQAAHRAKVWHRDVKPGNVLLARDGRVVLTDFGLATFDGDGGVTRSGLILGSAQYIAPERARDGVSGPEADMWSLGATLYAAVEGRSPYARESSMATLTALATAPPDTPRRAGPLRPVLMGLLRKNPRHRLTATQAEKLLRAVASGDVKGKVKLPRQRSEPAHREPASDVAVPGEVAQALVLTAHSGPGSGSDPGSGSGSSDVATSTQETYQYARRRAPRWPWAVVATIVVGLVAAGAIVLLNRPGGTARAAGPTATPTPTRTLTAEMGIAACSEAPEGTGTPVVGAATVPQVALGAPPGWVYYHDQTGFFVALPPAWRTWRVGSVVCFREPSGSRAAAVIPDGPRSGDPQTLIHEYETAWTTAAGVRDYRELGISPRTFGDGPAAEVEYTFVADETVMHGANLLIRVRGQVFLLCWLGAEYSWASDNLLKNAFQPSFAFPS